MGPTPGEEKAGGTSKVQGLLLNVVVSLCSLVVLFLVLEVAVRFWLFYIADDESFRHYASLRQLQAHETSLAAPTFKYVPHRYLGYVPTPNHRYRQNRHNALGYRGDEIVLPKPENEFRIVCMGGSTTYTGWVNDCTRSYPAQLEAVLQERGYPVSVVNAGVEGWTTFESLINLELRVLDLDPDVIIVAHAVNDIVQRFVWPPECFKGDNSGARGAIVSERFMPGIFEYSTLFRVLLVRTGYVLPHSALPRVYDMYQPTFYGFTWREQALAQTYPQGVFKEVSARRMLEVNGPQYFRQNLKHIVCIANSNSVVPLLATFPYCRNFDQEPWVTAQEFVWAYDEANAVIRDVASELHAMVFDLAEAFPPDPQYFTDGIHVNETGARLKAELFAQFVIENGLIADRPRPVVR